MQLRTVVTQQHTHI